MAISRTLVLAFTITAGGAQAAEAAQAGLVCMAPSDPKMAGGRFADA